MSMFRAGGPGGYVTRIGGLMRCTSPEDQILFDQFEETWAADPVLADQAQSNTLDNFALAFKEKFVGTIAKRMNQNEEIVKKVLDDPDFASELAGYYERKLYARLRTPSAESASA